MPSKKSKPAANSLDTLKKIKGKGVPKKKSNGNVTKAKANVKTNSLDTLKKITKKGVQKKKSNATTSKDKVNGNTNSSDAESNAIQLPAVRMSDETVTPTSKWTNKQRVLVFSSRGVDYRGRHLMKNMRTIMPHAKADTKMDKKDQLFIINEVCEIKNCNNCIFFEAKKKQDLYMWVSNVPAGPSVKFLVENVHTMEELKMTGNCLCTSRPILSFDAQFDSSPQLRIIKELFIQVFGTPRNHPRSQPFIDHVMTFGLADGRIWFRNYQLVDGASDNLAEIGPRFVLHPIKIFSGSFGGETLYENPKYISPNQHRRRVRHAAADKYLDQRAQKAARAARPKGSRLQDDPTEEVFQTH